ncbi:preprotein translocase subunit SecA [Candidatus Poriferisodalis sp.]|uniref:preprotein translocase subunit SecA n=1 Tax=Candidatus Poriferisodalis sp. TaxID=3101277 RepID=UPI003B017439
MALFQRMLRAGEGKKLRLLEALVPEVNAVEPDIERLADDELRARTGDFRAELDRGADLNDILVDAFAVTREAARRVIGQRHYDVQIIGGAALHFGWVAEMRTGEGKTLVSTLPVYLNALSGKGAHVVTVNDYLAARDAEWMGRIHRFLGLEVGLVVPGPYDTVHKRSQYAADVTYGTNNEFGFDYLRDNMAPNRASQTQRGHNFCIVDEVDSILIDEARTPLIISGRVADAAKLYQQFARVAASMTRDVDYEVEEDKRNVAVLEPGINKVERALNIDNLYDQVSANLVHQMNAALRAKELYRRDKDYVVSHGEVKIVDEFTGRILEGRRWSEGLHQAVEAKEGVAIKEENQTLATITLQNYFRLYDKLAGMTGTATTEAAEFGNTYGLDVIPVPTHLPVVRADHGDLIYKTEGAKLEAVVDDLAERISSGQPTLVGTVTVENSEKLSAALERRGIDHSVLNAKEHTREAEIIAQAGRLGSVTVATNMAGRGVDILLGGNPEGLARRDLLREKLDPDDPDNAAELVRRIERYEPECRAEGDEVRKLGGLYVLGTERHESRRIDNQLRGRSGRQGDPGESRFYLSLEDDLMRLFATGAVNWVMDRTLPDDVPLEAKMVTKAIERAQNTVEQKNAEIRKNVLKYDEVMNEQRKVIYARREQILGGDDLRAESLGYVREAAEAAVLDHCDTDEITEWDFDALLATIRTYWPSELTDAELSGGWLSGEGQRGWSVDDAVELVCADGEHHYEAREAEVGPEAMREVERQVMLRLIDQRWREHLADMDHLREGIHLRGIGQKDPVAEWQREGFDMFGAMLERVYRDFVAYVMHVQVTTSPIAEDADPDDSAGGPAEPRSGTRTATAPNRTQTADVRYSAPDLTPSTVTVGNGADGAGTAASPQHGPSGPSQSRRIAAASGGTIVKSAEEKLGRNDPCHCGSGRKFKHCCGR